MGYSTHFTLEITEAPVTRATPEDALVDLRETNEEARYCLDEDGSTCEGGRWYDHESDLRAVSKKYPRLLFKLSGEGEENEDMWDKYFLNGKMQDATARVVKPPFSMEELS